MRDIRLVFAFLGQFLKGRMAYRLDFLLSIFTTLISTVLGFVFIFVIFGNVSALQDWSYYEILFIYGFSLIPIATFSLISTNLWFFGEKFIVEGNFDRILLRPVGALFQVLFESFRVESIPDILVGFYIVFYSANKLGLNFGFLNFLILVGLALLSFVILISFFGIVAALSFWVEDRMGIGAPLFNMIVLARYPATIYNNLLKLLLTSLFPFAYIAFVPATYFLRPDKYSYMLLALPAVALFFAFLCKLVWQKGSQRYGSTGT